MCPDYQGILISGCPDWRGCNTHTRGWLGQRGVSCVLIPGSWLEGIPLYLFLEKVDVHFSHVRIGMAMHRTTLNVVTIATTAHDKHTHLQRYNNSLWVRMECVYRCAWECVYGDTTYGNACRDPYGMGMCVWTFEYGNSMYVYVAKLWMHVWNMWYVNACMGCECVYGMWMCRSIWNICGMWMCVWNMWMCVWIMNDRNMYDTLVL